MKPWHVIVMLVVVVLLFGARRLPDLAKSVGQSLKIVQADMKELGGDHVDDAPASTAPGVGPASTVGTEAPGSPQGRA